MVDEVKKKEEVKDRFSLTSIATQTATVFQDNKTGEVIDNQTLLLKISNALDKIGKNILGGDVWS